MFKKISILFILLITLISSCYAYNSSYTDLVIDPDSWCSGQEITIKVYNETDFENRKEIKADLCDPDENPDDDNCLAFKNISEATVKIYNGPIESLGLLLDTKTSKGGEFTTIFPEVTDYYYEITPKGNYNELTGYFEGIECKFTSETTTTISTPQVKLYNLSFTDSSTSTFIKIENTQINQSSDILVSSISDLALRNLPSLDYKVYKTIEVKGIKDINYTSLTIDTQIPNREPIIKVFKFNTKNSNWEEINNFVDYQNKIVIEESELGIYTISGNSKIEEEIITTQEVESEVSNNIETTENEVGNDLIINENTNSLLDNNEVLKEESSNTLTYLLIIIFLILGGLIGIAIVHHNKTKNLNPNTSNSNNKKEDVKNLESISNISEKASEYVKKYKDTYTKDQLYRALKEANVPSDVIDKVFAKEY